VERTFGLAQVSPTNGAAADCLSAHHGTLVLWPGCKHCVRQSSVKKTPRAKGSWNDAHQISAPNDPDLCAGLSPTSIELQGH